MLKVITCIGPGGWDLYGRRFVESALKFWPESLRLEVWFHDCELPASLHERVRFRSLDDNPTFMKQKTRHGAGALDGPSLNYSFKAAALGAALEPHLEWLAFIDADTETFRPLDGSLLAELFDPAYDLTYLWRRSVGESEGSWFAFNLRTQAGASLLSDYWGIYDSGEAFHYKKAHDNAVLDRLVNIHRAHGLKVKDLSGGGLGLDAFHQGPLGGYMVHYKGPQKDTVASPSMAIPQRYEIVADLAVQACQTAELNRIVEVGTHNGSRAIHLANALFAAGWKSVEYIGYDIFEEGVDRQHESHSKAYGSYDLVYWRLKNYAEVQKRRGLTFNFDLIKGNTLQTLGPLMDARPHNMQAFTYLDGGHSFETVKSDYNALAELSHFIVFDDIVEPEANAPPGPHGVFHAISDRPKTLIQTGDGYAGCAGKISLGLVGDPKLPMLQPHHQIQVKPVDSVGKSEQMEHIKHNTARLERWLEMYQAHGQTALMVSAGPTLPTYLGEIRVRQSLGAKVFAVKHAVPTLVAAGIQPDYTVVLDPRPLDGVSTHGVHRTTLFEGLEGVVLLATMTHTSVADHLLEKLGPDRVWGWHAHTQLTVDRKLEEFSRGLTVGGGTCAATRMPMLAFIMGFRRMTFYGYDLFYPEGTDQTKLKQPLMKVQIGKQRRDFLTTGELVAAMQDLSQCAKWIAENRLTVEWRGNGAGPVIWNDLAPNYQNPKELA